MPLTVVRSGIATTSTVPIEFPSCSNAFYARDNMFCCANASRLPSWQLHCVDWTKGGAQPDFTVIVPADSLPLFHVWPPEKILITKGSAQNTYYVTLYTISVATGGIPRVSIYMMSKTSNTTATIELKASRELYSNMLFEGLDGTPSFVTFENTSTNVRFANFSWSEARGFEQSNFSEYVSAQKIGFAYSSGATFLLKTELQFPVLDRLF